MDESERFLRKRPVPQHAAVGIRDHLRAAQPDLPVLLMSRPKFTLNGDDRRRLRVIEATYDRAKEAGDDKILLLDGPTLMALAGDEAAKNSFFQRLAIVIEP